MQGTAIMKNSVKILLFIILLLVLVQGVRAAETYQFVTKWGTQGSGDGQFISPVGVAVDTSGNVYVAAEWNYRIQKFSSDGTFLNKWGTQGTGDGQFSRPLGVAVDSAGNVYVADTTNNRIQKFSSTGTFLVKWGTLGTGDGQFNYPVGIAVDSSGNVYVVDYGNNRIEKFSSTGTLLAKWGTYGTGEGQFLNPIGIAVDASGNVYVADGDNHRIQKFAPSSTSAGTVTRSMPATAAPDATITVTLTPGATLPTAPDWGVTETLPAGWTFVSTTADGYQLVAGAHRFTRSSATPITYTVTAPAAEGSYTFSGTFVDGNADYGTVGGATSVTVGTVVSPVQRYDINGIPGIQKAEAVAAITDYLFNHTLSKADAVAVVTAYLFPTSIPTSVNIQMIGNVYGIASNPAEGIDEIKFSIGLAMGSPSVDLSLMKIVFTTPATTPQILTHGTSSTTSTFTTKENGQNAITVMTAQTQVEIDFKVTDVPKNTMMIIEIRPTVGASLPFSKTTPAEIQSINVLY